MNQNIIVFESSANLRALGRDALKGKWKLGVMGTLLYFALTIIPMIILNAIFGDGAEPSGISSVYSILITGPMTLGYAMFAISIFRKRETSPAEVFYGFERFGKAFGLYIVMSIFIFLWTLLLIVPGIIAAFRYSMSFYILADNPNMGIMEALNASKEMMRGNKWKFFCLNLSFIGWAILGALSCGIGYLWLLPYIEVTIIAFYDIANGSLRSVRTLEGEMGYRNDSVPSDTDPITVYKEDPRIRSRVQEAAAEPVREPASDSAPEQELQDEDKESERKEDDFKVD